MLNNELSRRFDQNDFGVVQDMEKLLVAAASGKQVTLPSSVTSSYAEDLDNPGMNISVASQKHVSFMCESHRSLTVSRNT